MKLQNLLKGVLALTVAAVLPSTLSADDPYRAQPEGALSGASVFVSPGHGWMWSNSQQRWVTQRGITNGLIEDHSNAEWVLQYLVPYLENAGARVYTTRERSMQTNEVIIDAGENWKGSDADGDWAIESEAYGAYQGDFLSIASTSGEPTAKLSFVPNIPEAGYYPVYIRYRPSILGATATDAEFVINHTGGKTIWVQDLNRDGYTWKYAGEYYFEAGQNPEVGSVVVTNKSKKGGRITVDAIRFGGGMGTELAPDGLPSGEPRWEESGMYYAQFMGMDYKNQTRPWNSVRAIPLWAEWECEEWEAESAVYLSWHTNANNGKSRGLFGFVYGPDDWGDLDSFAGIDGSIELMQSVFDKIGSDVHSAYDPDWRVARVVTRWLGETNPFMNTKMPSALIEVGFHDNPEDAKYILDPQFRRLTARAAYQGIVDYYKNEKDGFNNDTLLPEPPTHFRATTDEQGRPVLEWEAPEYGKGDDAVLGDKADKYVVYTSTNGLGFDNGTIVNDTDFRLSAQPQNEIRYYKVAALNKGGESLASEVLAVSPSYVNQSDILLVYGFDRLDGDMNIIDDDGQTQRGILRKMNTQDYILEHAEALRPLRQSFDSTSNEAVENGEVNLNDYKMVVWMLGQEKGESEALSAKERKAITMFRQQGGALLLSGSEGLFDLASTSDGRSFLQNEFKLTVSSDDANTLEVTPDAEQLFGGLNSVTLNEGTYRGYPVTAPDVLVPGTGAQAAFAYGNGTGAAGVVVKGDAPAIILGFPFESIVDPQLRSNMMARAYYFLTAEDDSPLASN